MTGAVLKRKVVRGRERGIPASVRYSVERQGSTQTVQYRNISCCRLSRVYICYRVANFSPVEFTIVPILVGLFNSDKLIFLEPFIEMGQLTSCLRDVI